MRVSARVALVSLIIATSGFAGCSSSLRLSDAPSEGLVSPEYSTEKIAPGEETSESSAKGESEHRRRTRRLTRKTSRRKNSARARPRSPRSRRHPRHRGGAAANTRAKIGSYPERAVAEPMAGCTGKRNFLTLSDDCCSGWSRTAPRQIAHGAEPGPRLTLPKNQDRWAESSPLQSESGWPQSGSCSAPRRPCRSS